MVVRGAPAIGVAAAMGVALGVRDSRLQTNLEQLREDFDTNRDHAWRNPSDSREFVLGDRADETTVRGSRPQPTPIKSRSPQRLIEEALGIQAKTSKTTGAWDISAKSLLAQFRHDLTHCNAGALATAGYGTALGVIRAAVENGKRLKVLADETRPFLQGARLTAWELWKDDIDVRVISDNMAGSFMRQGLVDAVIVGADRIAANGDVANKIGTYTVAVLAKQHEIPFYVAAPISTLDLRFRTVPTFRSSSASRRKSRTSAACASFPKVCPCLIRHSMSRHTICHRNHHRTRCRAAALHAEPGQIEGRNARLLVLKRHATKPPPPLLETAAKSFRTSSTRRSRRTRLMAAWCRSSHHANIWRRSGHR